jgi:hypothetical protein
MALTGEAGEKSARGWRAHLWHRLVELVIVFVGVYAAFKLNSYYDDRKDALRRAQLVSWLEQDTRASLADVMESQAKLEKELATFKAALAAKQAPALDVLITAGSDYDTEGKNALLSGGAFNLLSVETIQQINAVEQLMRQAIYLLRHDQQLSDQLILPHRREGWAAFYNPADGQLWPEYRWYPLFLEREIVLAKEVKPEMEKLLQLLAKEKRKRNP